MADIKEIESGWPEKVLKRQRDWVGRSEGAYIDFQVKDHDEKVRVFTTRIDTIFGATAIVRRRGASDSAEAAGQTRL